MQDLHITCTGPTLKQDGDLRAFPSPGLYLFGLILSLLGTGIKYPSFDLRHFHGCSSTGDFLGITIFAGLVSIIHVSLLQVSLRYYDPHIYSSQTHAHSSFYTYYREIKIFLTIQASHTSNNF
jgi:hypothetical protein